MPQPSVLEEFALQRDYFKTRPGPARKRPESLPPSWQPWVTEVYGCWEDSDLPTELTTPASSTASLASYQPTAKQQAFHDLDADEVLFGGAAGGGKSVALLMDTGQFCADHAGVRAALFRRTYPELWRTAILAAAERFPAAFGGTYHHTTHEWRFPNGSVLEFCYAKAEMDVLIYQSAEYQRLAFDELTHFSLYQYSYLISRLRSVRPGLRLQVKAGTNPGGVGHTWVKARFGIAEQQHGAPFLDEHGRTLAFMPARVDDNPHLMEADPAYVTRLRQLPDAERRALLEGDWDVFAGQVFGEWRRDRHVIRPHALPTSWPRWRAVDYGTARPFVCLWLCQDPATLRVYVYREISQAGVVPASRQAQMIADATPLDEPIRFTVADPAMAIRQADTGASISDVYAAAGVTVHPASNERLNGLSRVHDFLAEAPDGRPYLQVFETCPRLCANMPALVYDQHVVEDVDTEGPDDEYDALRYGLMAAHWMQGSQSSRPTKRRYRLAERTAAR